MRLALLILVRVVLFLAACLVAAFLGTTVSLLALQVIVFGRGNSVSPTMFFACAQWGAVGGAAVSALLLGLTKRAAPSDAPRGFPVEPARQDAKP